MRALALSPLHHVISVPTRRNGVTEQSKPFEFWVMSGQPCTLLGDDSSIFLWSLGSITFWMSTAGELPKNKQMKYVHLSALSLQTFIIQHKTPFQTSLEG